VDTKDQSKSQSQSSKMAGQTDPKDSLSTKNTSDLTPAEKSQALADARAEDPNAPDPETIPAIGPTDTDGDGEPDAGVEEAQDIRQRYEDGVKATTDAEAARREAKGLPAEGPEQKRRANSLAEALYPDENVSEEAKEAVAPKSDASHA
jgi:hypothetical protein